ncbi:MAG: DUF4350 domain-containing protein [Nocardioidaceae bacterium]
MSWLARHRVTVLILLLALGSALVYGLLSGGETRGGVWDPENPGRQGGQAVARVLDRQGVDVEVVRSADELEGADVDDDTTVVVTSTELLGASTARRLRDASASGHLLLVEPGPTVTDALGLPPGTPVTVDAPRDAGCGDDQLGDLEVDVDQGVEYASSQGCFAGDSGFLVGTPTHSVTLVGAGQVLQNDHVLDGDNAAAALRLLGERSRLVWYVPSLGDLTASDGVSLGSLAPDVVKPGLWVLALAVVGLVLWRGRRLGPLATEPLPVSVKAIETTHSRGRIYRKANDRGHAAEVLRSAARRRLAEQLHLPATTAQDVEGLLASLAPHSPRSAEELRLLLGPASPAPASDKALITLANDLAELDREVRRT